MFSFQPNQLTQAFQYPDPELPDPLACSRQGGVEAAFFLAMAFALRSAFCLYFEVNIVFPRSKASMDVFSLMLADF